VHPRPRRLPLVILTFLAALATGVTMPSVADAVCNVSACDASILTSNPACCTASTCTIDGTLTVTAASCTFDFGTRNLTVSGQIAAQGKAVTLMAKSMKLTGLIDVRGPGGADAGSITIMTNGMTAVAYSQEGGTSAQINASSTTGAGGHVTIKADGMVSLTKGTIVADGGPAASGGIVDIATTAGDVSVQIMVSASSGATAPVPTGRIVVTTPGNLTFNGSGRFFADRGDIDLDVGLLASFADGSILQTNLGGGSITLVSGSASAFGEFRADGEDGSVDLRTVTGPMLLQRPSQGITVGSGAQSISLATEAPGTDGLLTMDMPILSHGTEVEISSAGSIVISKKIETTGILDSEAGDISIDAEEDVDVTKAIVGLDVYGTGDLSIDGRDVTIEANLDFRGGLEAAGGQIDIVADRDLVIQGDIFFNVSGADSSDAGRIDMQAGHDVTVGPSVEFLADGSPIGAGGSILILAGEGFGEHLPGDILMQGDVIAHGHAPVGAFVVMEGCDVTIPAGAVLDVTGDTMSSNRIVARTSLTIAGQLKATAANVLEFPEGTSPSLTGSFTPARSAGMCSGGTVTANGCQRPVCTALNPAPSCLYPCPNCGNGGPPEFPETCEIGSGGPFCSGTNLCDARCRLKTCPTPNSCTVAVCDAEAAVCTYALKPNDTPCDSDNSVCTGVGTCANGSCHLTPGSVLQCNDGNPCTGPDTCDPVNGCQNPNRPDGPGVPGCDDGNFCTGAEQCLSGECVSGVLPCTPPEVCNPQSQECGAQACTSGSQCVDGNPCTDDVCQAGFCANPPFSAQTSCDDGDLCNGVRMCNGSGICLQPTAPVVCDDNDLCTVDSCNPSTGTCIFDQTAGCCTVDGDCGDGNACTADTCNASNTCDHVAITCNDNDPCTTDSCNAQNGCTTTQIDPCQTCVTAATCPDDAGPGSECTDKACLDGRCQQVSNPNCCQGDGDCTDIDSNPCTQNGPCVANRCAGPTPLPGAPCGTTCNPATCQGSQCVPDPPMNCSDNNDCTTDLCADGQGCTHTPIALCCMSLAACVDQNVCTNEACDLDAFRCVYPISDPTCTPCVGGDPFECGPRCSTACQGGRCADVAPNCDDNDACTNDLCDAAAGCTHSPNTDIPGCMLCQDAGCDDDDLCTTDHCNGDGSSACVHDPKTSYDAILCRFDSMKAELDAAVGDAVSDKVRKKVTSTLTKARSKIDKARAATKCSKSRSLIGKIRGPLRKLQRTLNRLAGKQIDAALATRLATLAGEAAAKADEARAGLGC
jgi:hypothetical protein